MRTAAIRELLCLEETFLGLLIAMGTKAMRWLSVCHLWLKAVGDRTGSETLHLIALLFSFPIFEAHNLLFKITYALGSRRLRLASEKKRLLGLDDMFLERDFDIIDARLSVGSV